MTRRVLFALPLLLVMMCLAGPSFADTTMAGKLYKRVGNNSPQLGVADSVTPSATNVQGTPLTITGWSYTYTANGVSYSVTVQSPGTWPGGNKTVIIGLLRTGVPASQMTKIPVLGVTTNNVVYPVLK